MLYQWLELCVKLPKLEDVAKNLVLGSRQQEAEDNHQDFVQNSPPDSSAESVNANWEKLEPFTNYSIARPISWEKIKLV